MIGLTRVCFNIALALLTGIICIEFKISLSISERSFLFSSEIKTFFIPALVAAYNFSWASLPAPRDSLTRRWPTIHRLLSLAPGPRRPQSGGCTLRQDGSELDSTQ